MNQKELMISNIKQHLINCNLPPLLAGRCANGAYIYFLHQVGNSKDAYKETCDYAGGLAKCLKGVGKFKYKSPTCKTGKRVKKPQEAFNF